MQRWILFSLLAIFVVMLAGTVLAAEGKSSYNYITVAELKARLQQGKPTHIIDIQVEEEFAKHHILGATPTYAYPVKEEADRAKLATILQQINSDSNPIVIVCPRGAGGATRTYDYLLTQGVAPERLLILEKGQAGWDCFPIDK